MGTLLRIVVVVVILSAEGCCCCAPFPRPVVPPPPAPPPPPRPKRVSQPIEMEAVVPELRQVEHFPPPLDEN
jgi:hypothetical protein